MSASPVKRKAGNIEQKRGGVGRSRPRRETARKRAKNREMRGAMAKPCKKKGPAVFKSIYPRRLLILEKSD
jgi:hypothetical protein